jgi:membrane protease YdiL (CAAX protease family)
VYFIRFAKSKKEWRIATKDFLFPFFLLFCVLITPSLMTNFVKFDFKLSFETMIFSLDNLFIVAFSEEVFFRGFLQKQLMLFFSKHKGGLEKFSSVLSLALASLAFAAFHLRGGILLVAFAFVAGMFYGYAFQRSEKIEAAILTHFCFNFTHFVFFTYPAYGVA